jgi:flavin-dependent dehydrogenase
VGDAACQVFPAHGSGTGAGLIAARLLADAAGRSDDPGAESSLWDYQAGWHRGLGAVCAAYDVFRRYAQSRSREEISGLLSSGLLNESNVRPGLEQAMLRPGIGDILPFLTGLIRAPRLASLAPVLARMSAVPTACRRFPLEPDPVAFDRWAWAVGWLMSGI